MHKFNNDKLSIIYSGSSDIGLVREENQDSFGIYTSDDLSLDSEKGQLFIIADGMGGHVGGKEASTLAIATVKESYSNLIPSNSLLFLKQAIENANTKIFNAGADYEGLRRMGTTCSILFLKNNYAAIGHVGDSRIYKVEKNKIEQLTTDHTRVNELLKEGIITKEEAVFYPAKSVLTRALGIKEKVEIDIIENIQLKEGLIFILCSDGLSPVTENEILKIVTSNNPRDSCGELISLANKRGGMDNVTVIVVKVVN